MEPGVGYAALDLDARERVVRLGRELGVTSFGINLRLLRPGQRGRIHRHRQQEEGYLVLEGELTRVIDGESPCALGRERPAAAGLSPFQAHSGPPSSSARTWRAISRSSRAAITKVWTGAPAADTLASGRAVRLRSPSTATPRKPSPAA